MYCRAGNEPDLLAVYLFCFAGRSDLTQKVIYLKLHVTVDMNDSKQNEQ